MIWRNPEAFFLIIPVLAIVVYLIFFGKKRRPSLRWSDLSLMPKNQISLRVWLRWVPFFLQFLGVLCLITALARPQKTDVQLERSLKGIDIMIALDISFSMMVEDMRPGTRLESAKKVINEFLDGLYSDRVGLILFSGESYTQTPLTLDYALLKKTVDLIQTSSNIKQGTAIGEALANASARLRHSLSKSRVIILLTDGENNAGSISPETAISIAKGYGIKIYCVGIGSQGWAKIPIKYKDALGREVQRYTNIKSQINIKLLNQISKKTGGKFYLAGNLQLFKNIFNEIGRLEKTKHKAKKWVQFEEKFQDWLKMGFFLYFISFFLSFTVFGRVF